MTLYGKQSLLKKLISTTAVALAALMVTPSVMPSGLASAQEAEAPEGRQFSASAGEIVSAANELITANQFSAGLAKLNEALALPELNPYEKSIIYQLQGSSYYEMNQYGPAISSFENAINAGGLLPNEADALRVNIAQLLIANGQYAQGAQALENYINRGGAQKPAYTEMLVQAWVQSENYAKALPWAEKWFNAASPKERKHFDLMNFLYNNLGQQGRQADIVKQMINRWPEDKTLWDAWASMLANGGREEEAFEVSKMLYLGGALKDEQDLMKVVQYYSFYDMPFQAALILEKEMNAGRITRDSEKMVQLSSLFRQAREYKRAIPVLESAAASSGQAKLYADLGEALYNEGQCVKAETAFKDAINKGYDAGKSWMLIATCRYEDTQKEERIDCKMTEAQKDAAPITKARQSAIQAFEQVPSSSREGRNAKKWISFIRAEREAVENRCIFEANVEKELCFAIIKGAYDNEVFVGKFEIDPKDQKCMAFKEEYDSKFRVRIVDQ
ncbi:hypothetical protein N9W89_06950 [Hellea sp.]|nr:hypothetical protein [Hellea sp.]